MYKNTRAEGFGKEVVRRIMLGTFVLSEGYYDAYYTKAQKMRRLIKDEIQKVLKGYDFILLPTAPGPAFEVGVERNNPVEMYLEDLFTVPASVAGLPAISLPMAKKDHLPLGLQVIGDEFQEEDLLAFSEYLLTLS
jgi:aspartyl-tRNA(Asn)/glutamyl-tRNA(Gln) amidotransferase subunit A